MGQITLENIKSLITGSLTKRYKETAREMEGKREI